MNNKPTLLNSNQNMNSPSNTFIECNFNHIEITTNKPNGIWEKILSFIFKVVR